MEIQKLADNLGLDLEEYTEILELYVERTSSDLKELKTALAAGDGEKVHSRSHSIKGASGNLGLQELYEQAKMIDDLARENLMEGLEPMVRDFTKTYEKLVEKLNS
ncbi:MAG: Hpt domain-containing protein [Deltaproteobacteria bacterium]|nr:Hpt domain-containing protein [Deltaproteobacteria bacterium]